VNLKISKWKNEGDPPILRSQDSGEFSVNSIFSQFPLGDSAIHHELAAIQIFGRLLSK
jgi:hypothetical protein